MHPELDWLYSTQLFGIKLGLESVQRLLLELNLPRPGQKFIHVAGTNGKGSTCAFAHAILSAAGINAGIFTSPHLIHFAERIRDSHRQITSEEIETDLARIRHHVRDWDPHPTFFEITLALALDWFAQRGLEWVVLETGLGGRLDATNAITPAAAVITSISLDHTQILGSTLALIAAEKAGIIKPHIPIITLTQTTEALDVITRTAHDRSAPLTVIDTPCDLPLGLPGPHQRWNAALAIAALRATDLHLTPDAITTGLRSVSWPARFQRVTPSLIIDGAHNPDAARVLVQTWREHFPTQKATLIFGAVAGKDIANVLHTLAPIVAEWHLVHIDSPRALSAEELHTILQSIDTSSSPISTHATLKAALQATQNKAPILIAGSLYLAGEALSLLQDKAEAFQRSMQ